MTRLPGIRSTPARPQPAPVVIDPFDAALNRYCSLVHDYAIAYATAAQLAHYPNTPSPFIPGVDQ